MEKERPVNIVVYTAIFGRIDHLWSPLPIVSRNAQHVCFTDKPKHSVGLWTHRLTEKWPVIVEGSQRFRAKKQIWNVRVVKPMYGARRTARYYKALAHKHFPDADVTIWLDGNVRLLIPAAQAVKKWLRNSNMAIFNHPDRDCLYKEANFCAQSGKGNPVRLSKQTAVYRKAGMPENWGMPETKCVIRRNTPQVTELNELWWQQLKQYSVRDQVSLPYCCWKLGLKWRVIPGRVGLASFPGDINHAFWMVKHSGK
jgi:hypothetical protein